MKKFILASATSIEVENFRDYCYKNLGLNIVTEASLSDSSFLTVRLDDAVCGQDYFYASHKNEDKKIFMDKSYFIPDECAKKLRANGNFDMSLDIMIFSIWEELNENSNRC